MTDLTDEQISEPHDPGDFPGDIFYGHPDKTTLGTHRWANGEWVRLPSETESLVALLARARAENVRLRADAQAAVALAMEKAAEVVKGLHEKLCTAGHPTLMLGQVTTQTLALEAAIRTLADTDGLARVEALRKERDAAALESQTAWALLRVANDNTAGAISERDRLAADLAAAQAQIEALRDVYWKLRSYAVHDDGCKLNKPPYKVGSCSCGLTSALARGEAAFAALPAKEGE